ncbi:MAG: hypothetical protein GWP07_00840 [Xanthomonadaceae bacterium]|nr:hypothetical protein [Xanthomonadaceae bacterium]
MYKTFIFYCSPAGTTSHVAEVIEKKLAGYGRQVTICTLGKEEGKLSEIIRDIKETPERVCLFIGSPVYSSHALPLVMDFIARLPQRRQVYAVPFATWGGATSGLALEEMGEALKDCGYGLTGAARIVAVHSLMWESDNPVGAGHPDAKDDRLIEDLAVAVDHNLQLPEPLELSSQALFYQPAAAAVEMRKLNLEIARGILPKRLVNEDLCTQCGICAEQCPVAALTLAPYPVYADHCILCFNCMRCCPEKAIEADLSPIHKRVRERAENYQEVPPSALFLPGEI